MHYLHYYESPLGRIIASADGNSLTGLWFAGQDYSQNPQDDKVSEKMLPVFAITDRWLDIYFAGHRPDFTPPLYFKVSAFRAEVFKVLREVPYGQTITYGEIAKKIAMTRNLQRISSQAVGGALSHNPILIIIPCHRVIGKNGSLTGYVAGTDKKMALLTIEKMHMDYDET